MKHTGLILCLALSLGSCKSLTSSGDVGTFKVGERAQVGPLIYNVIDTQWNVSLGHDAVPRVPKNRFFILNISVVNGGGTEDQSVPTFNLVDDQGENYPELDNGEGVPDWIGFSRKIRPADGLSGNIAFDVPPKHYRLKVTDESDQKFAWIDLPLDFGAPPPVADNPSGAAQPRPTPKR